MELSDKAIIKLLNEGSERAFEQVFKTYFKPLYAYAYTMLKDDSMAEEMVQNVFFNIWNRKERLKIDGPIKAYLYRSVHNESLNFLKHRKVRTSYQVYSSRQETGYAENPSEKIMEQELSAHIQKALNELPPQCRLIFQLSRFEQLKYREIARELDISVKTVENQMGKALKVLRTKLAEFLPATLFLLWTLLTEGGRL